MCEDPYTWYTNTEEKVVVDVITEKSEILIDLFTEEVVLIDLSTGLIED